MGLFSLFRSDSPAKLQSMKANLFATFSNLKDNLETQNKWINYLHTTVNEMKTSHDSHKLGTTVHIEKIHTNIDNVHKWIDHLHQNSKQQSEQIKALEQAFKTAIDKYNQHIIELYKLLHAKNEALSHDLKKDMKNELLMELQSHMLEHRNYVKEGIGSFNSKLDSLSKAIDVHKKEFQDHKKEMELKAKATVLAPIQAPAQPFPKEVVKEVVKEMVYTQLPLTNPEQKLLNLLFTEHDPVAYTHLSSKTGHSVNTIRVNMNILKKKGLIEEHLLPNGVKLFNLKNKEKVKKMYNLQHI